MKGKGGVITYTISLVIYCVVVFILSLIIIGKVMNTGNTDMTTTMSEASYPIMTMRYAGLEFNELHGYGQSQDISKFRESITPFFSDRSIAFRVYTYGAEINAIKYELRNIADNRLIEDSELKDYTTSEGMLNGSLVLKDLISENQEYSLCIILETSKGQSIRYYTTVIESDNYNLKDKLEFIYNFSSTTFDKELAQEELTKYLETNASGDNSSFSYVDIHSSLDQLTWGNLAVNVVGEPIATIKDIDESTAVIFNDYLVNIDGISGMEYYMIQERYRIRIGNERVYLLSFERTMEQVFDPETSTMANNKIVLGITNKNVNMMENPDGSRVAFVSAGRLYSYNVTDNKLAEIFGFYEGAPLDKREYYNQHDIKIFSVDETGNVYFMVYGYMNRGIHEGMLGAAIYYYDSVLNSVEEHIFVPFDESYEIMCRDIEKLSYVNALSRFYLVKEDCLYEIDLDGKVCSLIADNLEANNFVANADSTMVAWNDPEDPSRIVWMSLKTNSRKNVSADSGEYIRPLGFFDENLIYGCARSEDVVFNDYTGDTFPMYRINIENVLGSSMKEYSENGIYVMDVDYTPSMIVLQRATYNSETAEYVATSEDQILNNMSIANRKIKVEAAITDNYETMIQIALTKEIDSASMQLLTPRQVIYEGERDMAFDREVQGTNKYYVYSCGQLIDIFDKPSLAVTEAYNSSGMVVDNRGAIIYRRTALASKNQIMAIIGSAVEGEGANETVSVCINTMLSYNGINLDTSNLVNYKAPVEILAENLEGKEVLDLTGCDLQVILYYVEKDIPVLAILEDGSAVLVIGYNELNTVVMNPLTGTVYKVGMNDSTDWFLKGGNTFITYVE